MMALVWSNHHRDIWVSTVPLPGNRCRQHDVERAQTIGGDHQQRAVGELEGVAHLAATEQVQAPDVGAAQHLHQFILPPAMPASDGEHRRLSPTAPLLLLTWKVQDGGRSRRCARGTVSTSKQWAIVASDSAPEISGSVGDEVAERRLVVARARGERLHGAVRALARPLRFDDERGEHLLREHDAAVQLDVLGIRSGLTRSPATMRVERRTM